MTNSEKRMGIIRVQETGELIGHLREYGNGVITAHYESGKHEYWGNLAEYTEEQNDAWTVAWIEWGDDETPETPEIPDSKAS
jgi:hypothetical protein